MAGDNAYTVLHAYSSTVSFDGFTIRDGNSDGMALGTQNDFDGNGGGAFQSAGTLTFANCRFYNNYASYGAAIYNLSGSLNLVNCSFVSNRARYVGGATNGRGQSNRISQCTFASNQSSRGAACTFYGSTATVTPDRSVGDYEAAVQVSGDLLNWSVADAAASTLAQTPSQVTLQFALAPDGSGRKFLRLQARRERGPRDFALDLPEMSFAGIPAGSFHMGSSAREAPPRRRAAALTRALSPTCR